ncbi:hypothetical protein SKAU_G00204340 [Synaphobranchus kaupii]|uniref:Uncharacterized protein n=1 Tax=Synaphobranchus kaupii TaxID=118154 RepID=A0A9Q1IYP1_SYNKA|nr:hypothetical protein SKAU_G00204340 [Synaphobranchus kaupii]
MREEVHRFFNDLWGIAVSKHDQGAYNSVCLAVLLALPLVVLITSLIVSFIEQLSSCLFSFDLGGAALFRTAFNENLITPLRPPGAAPPRSCVLAVRRQARTPRGAGADLQWKFFAG